MYGVPEWIEFTNFCDQYMKYILARWSSTIVSMTILTIIVFAVTPRSKPQLYSFPFTGNVRVCSFQTAEKPLGAVSPGQPCKYPHGSHLRILYHIHTPIPPLHTVHFLLKVIYQYSHRHVVKATYMPSWHHYQSWSFLYHRFLSSFSSC